MDAIIIKDFRFEVSIGVHAHESTQRQTVSIDLEIGLPPESMRHDELRYTIDYESVAHSIAGLAESRHFGLVETFADRVASMLLVEFAAPWVRVSAAKVGILPNAGYVGVSVVRPKAATHEPMRNDIAASSRRRAGSPEDARTPSHVPACQSS